ncbi:hypothetical protein DWB77_00191 [Streptomyces hundungensis]|uniref:Uncharacterized protein n=1 Tax=Streptomyces hundungensis TaxID=1077946 RepID=A0A387H423_9ACTN|nr:hypothetical protein DWB77_00191 [Streptomyces hundungensis]
MSERLDMTVTYAVHNALRRKRGHGARAVAVHRAGLRRVLRVAPGWGMFQSAMHAHQAAEDRRCGRRCGRPWQGGASI